MTLNKSTKWYSPRDTRATIEIKRITNKMTIMIMKGNWLLLTSTDLIKYLGLSNKGPYYMTDTVITPKTTTMTAVKIRCLPKQKREKCIVIQKKKKWALMLTLYILKGSPPLFSIPLTK